MRKTLAIAAACLLPPIFATSATAYVGSAPTRQPKVDVKKVVTPEGTKTRFTLTVDNPKDRNGELYWHSWDVWVKFKGQDQVVGGEDSLQGNSSGSPEKGSIEVAGDPADIEWVFVKLRGESILVATNPPRPGWKFPTAHPPRDVGAKGTPKDGPGLSDGPLGGQITRLGGLKVKKNQNGTLTVTCGVQNPTEGAVYDVIVKVRYHPENNQNNPPTEVKVGEKKNVGTAGTFSITTDPLDEAQCNGQVITELTCFTGEGAGIVSAVYYMPVPAKGATNPAEWPGLLGTFTFPGFGTLGPIAFDIADFGVKGPDGFVVRVSLNETVQPTSGGSALVTDRDTGQQTVVPVEVTANGELRVTVPTVGAGPRVFGVRFEGVTVDFLQGSDATPLIAFTVIEPLDPETGEHAQLVFGPVALLEGNGLHPSAYLYPREDDDGTVEVYLTNFHSASGHTFTYQDVDTGQVVDVEALLPALVSQGAATITDQGNSRVVTVNLREAGFGSSGTWTATLRRGSVESEGSTLTEVRGYVGSGAAGGGKKGGKKPR